LSRGKKRIFIVCIESYFLNLFIDGVDAKYSQPLQDYPDGRRIVSKPEWRKIVPCIVIAVLHYNVMNVLPVV
jgi:hypothetical protein